MIRYIKPPFDPPKPNDLAGQLAEAIRAASADLASRKETELGHVITGCDGYPIVTIGDGTSCHDSAKASSGGGLALTANLGGARAVIQANLGRSQSPNSGYQGTGLSSGAIPPAMDAGAADVSIDPIDSTVAVTILAGESADPLSDFVGATITGKTGDSKRLFVCYGETSGVHGAGIWDDAVSGTETAVTGLSIDPMYVGALGGDKYALTKLYTATVSLVEAGAESGTSALPSISGDSTDYIYSAVAISRDLDTMAALHKGGKVYIGTSMLTSPSWAVLDLSATITWQVYGVRQLLFDHSGNLWLGGETPGTALAVIKIVAPPYSGVTTTLTPSWSDPSGSWKDAAPIAISRDGRYVASGVHVNQTLVDIWQVSTRARLRTLSIPIGYTDALPYGGMQFGPDGRLFAGITRDSDSHACLAVWTDFSSTPEIIDLGATAVGGWLSVSGDGQCVVVTDEPTAGTLVRVQPPYTAAGATVDSFVSGGGTREIQYQFEFDPSEAYVDATGLTLAASVTSTTGSGSSVTVVTRFDYANTSGTAAFGVIIEMPLPDGSTFVSATDGGLYDSEAGIVKWLIPSVAASATGYVECTMTTG